MLATALQSASTARRARRCLPPWSSTRSLCLSSAQRGPRSTAGSRSPPRRRDPRLDQAVSAAEAAIRAALDGARGAPSHKKKDHSPARAPPAAFSFPSQPPPPSKNHSPPRPQPQPHHRPAPQAPETAGRPGAEAELAQVHSRRDGRHVPEPDAVADQVKELRQQIVAAQKQLDTLQTRLTQPASALLRRLDRPGGVPEQDASVLYHLAQRYSAMSSDELAGRPPAHGSDSTANTRLRRSIGDAQAAQRHRGDHPVKPVYTVAPATKEPVVEPVVYDVYHKRAQTPEVPKQPPDKMPPNAKNILEDLMPGIKDGVWVSKVAAHPDEVKERMALTIDDLPPCEPSTVLHGLDRVLFNPGVSWLKDPRTGMYNYDARLQDLGFSLDVPDGEAAALRDGHISPSVMQQLAKRTKYVASNQTVADLLAHPYFNITGWRPPDPTVYGQSFKQLAAIGGFTMAARMPVQVQLTYDAHADAYSLRQRRPPAEPERRVFDALSEAVETMLVTPLDEPSSAAPPAPGLVRPRSGLAPRHAVAGKLAVRSALPYYDPRLPHKVFSIKPRGVCAMGAGPREFEGAGYRLEQLTGVLNSYERESFDLARSVLLRYALEARLGGLDGTFVAYHNTAQLFGFEYLSREQMVAMLAWDADQFECILAHCLYVLQQILDTATLHFPRQDLDLTVESHAEPHSHASFISLLVSQTEGELRKRAADERAYRRAFESGPGAPMCTRRTNAAFEVRVARRAGANSAEIKGPLPLGCSFAVDTGIVARDDVPEAVVACRERQATAAVQELTRLYVPHPDITSERERYLETILAQSPGALRAFYHDRHQRLKAHIMDLTRHHRPHRLAQAPSV